MYIAIFQHFIDLSVPFQNLNIKNNTIKQDQFPERQKYARHLIRMTFIIAYSLFK